MARGISIILRFMNIVYMGSAEFGLPALDQLYKSGHAITGIVSTPKKPKGRGLKLMDSPVVQFAVEKGLGPILTPDVLKSADFIESLLTLKADLFVVVAFRILPREVFSIPPLGTINIHASLLPKFRGPAPIQRAIAAGEKETGITIFRINEGIDSGNIILQKKTNIGEEETSEDLYARLSILGSQGILEAVALLEKGSVIYMKQDETLATPAPKLTKAEGRINWDLPAKTLCNMIRAFKPFPGAYTFFEGNRLHIENAFFLETNSNNSPGTICSVSDEGFDVQCHDGCLRVVTVKPEGKKSMSAKAYTFGRNIHPGKRFTSL